MSCAADRTNFPAWKPSAPVLRPVWTPSPPRPGYWLLRLKPRGPQVPARIAWIKTEVEPGNPDNLMERSPHLAAFIGGRDVELYRVWNAVKEEIAAAEYSFQMATISYSTDWAPAHPMLEPQKKVDFSKLPGIVP